MIVQKQRVIVDTDIESFIEDILAARNIKVLAITPAIAEASQQWLALHKDPADLLIAATAVCHNLTLVTKDSQLQAMREINTAW